MNHHSSRLMLTQGRGAPQNYHQAAAYLSRAGEQGHALAQYQLATLMTMDNIH